MKFKLVKISVDLISKVEDEVKDNRYHFTDLEFFFSNGGNPDDLRFDAENEQLKYVGSKTYLKAVLHTERKFLDAGIDIIGNKDTMSFIEKLEKDGLIVPRDLQKILKYNRENPIQILTNCYFFHEVCDEIDKIRIINAFEEFYASNSRPSPSNEELPKLIFSNDNQCLEFTGAFFISGEDRDWIFNYHDFLIALNILKPLRSINGKIYPF